MDRSINGTVRIALVADVAMYRDALCRLIAEEPSVTLVGAVSTLSQALELIRAERPAVLVVDMTTNSALELMNGVRAATPDVKVVAFAINEGEDVLRCAEAGAAGFVTREADPRQIVSAIASAARGELLCSPRTAAAIYEHLGTLVRRRAVPIPLTGRERQIARLLADGMSNKEIAVALRIEVPTVKNHVHSILFKLHVDTREQAAAALVAWLPR